MAKVKSAETSQELLALLEKSGLLAGQSLETARQAAEASPADPKSVARQLVKDGLLTPWQANQLLGGFYAFQVGGYQLLDQIGKGELGRVYLARHSETGRQVAVKMLASKSAGDPQLVERFLAEAKAASAFEHANVLKVLDVANDQDRPFVVTEFISGGDLHQRVEKKGPIAAREAANLVAQAADGMAYVHQKEVLHRNLKPSNLLVDDHGTVKILDVGVGQLRQADKAGNESTGELLLSALGYMSPEQIRGKDLDVRSDIYALGGTLYYLISGRVPYTATSNEERDVIRKTKRPVPLTTLKGDVPAELASLCDQMMALKASDRPASMAEVAQRLRQFSSDSTVAQEPESAPSAASPTSAAPVVESNSPEAVVDVAPTPDFAAEEPANEAAKLKESAVAPTATSPDTVKINIAGIPAESTATVGEPVKIQKKKKAAIAESLATTGEAADTVLGAAAKKNKRQRIILISTAAVSLAVIVISIVIMSFGSGETSPDVASGADSSGAVATADAAQVSPATTSQNDPENLPDPENVPDPPAAIATAADAVATSTATVPAPATPVNIASPPVTTPPAAVPPATNTVPAGPAGTPATPAPAPATVTPTTPTPTPPAATTPAATPATTTPATTTPATTTPATTTPATTTPAATTALPATTTPPPATTTPTPAAASTPMPATPAATTPAPAAPPTPAPAPPAAAPAPAKSAKTFEIAAAVELPRLPSSDASSPTEGPNKVLGKVNVDPKDTCFIAMTGGDKALRGRHAFNIRNAQGGTAPRDWEIVHKDPSGAEAVIATVKLPAQDLTFEWTPDGLKNPASSGLRNCVLKITAGQDQPHLLALRTVSLVPPMTIENLEKSTTGRFNLESPPDSSALKLEPTIPGQKFIFDAGGPDITKGDQWIIFGENKEQSPLALKLDVAVTAKGLQITADSYFLGGDKPQKLVPSLRKKLSVADLQRQAANIAGQLDNMKKLKKEDQAKLQNEMNLTNLARENIDKAIQRVQKLDELIQQLNGQGKIHFRVYYDAGERQVDLLKTDDQAPPPNK